MKNFISYTLFFYSFLAFAQLDEYPDEHISQYDLKGNVKSVKITEISDVWVKNDEKEKVKSIRELYFNQAFFLSQDYHTSNDGFRYLSEENIYDVNNNVLTKTEYSRKWKSINGKSIFTKALSDYIEKFEYDYKGNLLKIFRKSYRENDFYLVTKNDYENNLLIKSLRLNDHVSFRFHREGPRNTTLEKYFYNTKGLVVRRQNHIYDTKLFTRLDSIDSFTPIIFKEKDITYSKFNLSSEYIYKYNDKEQLIYQESIKLDDDYYVFDSKTEYEYFGSKEAKTLYNMDEKDFGGFSYDYVVKNNDTLVKAKWSFSKTNDEEQQNNLYYQINYNDDESFEKTEYTNGYIKSISYFNTKGEVFKYRDYEYNMTINTHYEYNDLGVLISKRSESKNSEGVITSRLIIKYDTKGNWVHEQLIDVPQNKDIRWIERIIAYYD